MPTETGPQAYRHPWPSLLAVRLSLTIGVNVGTGKQGVNHNSGSLRNLYRVDFECDRKLFLRLIDYDAIGGRQPTWLLRRRAQESGSTAFSGCRLGAVVLFSANCVAYQHRSGILIHR